MRRQRLHSGPQRAGGVPGQSGAKRPQRTLAVEKMKNRGCEGTSGYPALRQEIFKNKLVVAPIGDQERRAPVVNLVRLGPAFLSG